MKLFVIVVICALVGLMLYWAGDILCLFVSGMIAVITDSETEWARLFEGNEFRPGCGYRALWHFLK